MITQENRFKLWKVINKNLLNKIFNVVFSVTIIVMIMAFSYVIMGTKVTNLEQKANNYCKDFNGVRSTSDGLMGATVLCNKIAGKRSFLFLSWNTYEGTTIGKDGNLIQEGLVKVMSYLIGVAVICSIGMAVTSNRKEELLVK